jgi:hypothetical protein
MYVLDKLAFIAHPRTGSRSCRHVLMELGAAEIGSHHDVSEGAVKTILHQEGVIACTVRNGAVEIGSHHDVSEGAVKTILHQEGVIACTVRNIFDTLVSWWHNNNFQDGTGTPLKHEGPQPFSAPLVPEEAVPLRPEVARLPDRPVREPGGGLRQASQGRRIPGHTDAAHWPEPA